MQSIREKVGRGDFLKVCNAPAVFWKCCGNVQCKERHLFICCWIMLLSLYQKQHPPERICASEKRDIREESMLLITVGKQCFLTPFLWRIGVIAPTERA